MGATQGSGLRVGDERVVEIGTIAHGGHFIAHADGRTLFVRHAVTGERARVRVTEVNSKVIRADAVEILEPSPDRVPAPCGWAHPGGCGGCDFQHIALPAQRELKARVLTDALKRFGRLGHAQVEALGIEVQELPGHPDGLHWRSRMRWATAADGRTGLRAHRSHEVIPVHRCLIAAEGVDVPGAALAGKVVHEVRGRQWRLGSEDFWQVHNALPEALVDAVLQLGAPVVGQAWWDLYAGAGLFAAFLGEAVGPAGRIDAVESSSHGIRVARRVLHDLPQVRLHTSEVETWINGFDHEAPDGIVLDPPRSGAGRAVASAIAKAEVPTIVYLACDPVALARDVATFAEHGYRLTGLRAFDAFPMTHHLETVASLQRP